MIEIIIEIEGGCVVGVYTDAPLEQEFLVRVLEQDYQDIEGEQEANVIQEMLSGPGWRGID